MGQIGQTHHVRIGYKANPTDTFLTWMNLKARINDKTPFQFSQDDMYVARQAQALSENSLGSDAINSQRSWKNGEGVMYFNPSNTDYNYYASADVSVDGESGGLCLDYESLPLFNNADIPNSECFDGMIIEYEFRTFPMENGITVVWPFNIPGNHKKYMANWIPADDPPEDGSWALDQKAIALGTGNNITCINHGLHVGQHIFFYPGASPAVLPPGLAAGEAEYRVKTITDKDNFIVTTLANWVAGTEVTPGTAGYVATCYVSSTSIQYTHRVMQELRGFYKLDVATKVPFHPQDHELLAMCTQGNMIFAAFDDSTLVTQGANSWTIHLVGHGCVVGEKVQLWAGNSGSISNVTEHADYYVRVATVDDLIISADPNGAGIINLNITGNCYMKRAHAPGCIILRHDGYDYESADNGITYRNGWTYWAKTTDTISYLHSDPDGVTVHVALSGWDEAAQRRTTTFKYFLHSGIDSRTDSHAYATVNAVGASGITAGAGSIIGMVNFNNTVYCLAANVTKGESYIYKLGRDLNNEFIWDVWKTFPSGFIGQAIAADESILFVTGQQKCSKGNWRGMIFYMTGSSPEEVIGKITTIGPRDGVTDTGIVAAFCQNQNMYFSWGGTGGLGRYDTVSPGVSRSHRPDFLDPAYVGPEIKTIAGYNGSLYYGSQGVAGVAGGTGLIYGSNLEPNPTMAVDTTPANGVADGFTISPWGTSTFSIDGGQKIEITGHAAWSDAGYVLSGVYPIIAGEAWAAEIKYKNTTVIPSGGCSVTAIYVGAGTRQTIVTTYADHAGYVTASITDQIAPPGTTAIQIEVRVFAGDPYDNAGPIVWAKDLVMKKGTVVLEGQLYRDSARDAIGRPLYKASGWLSSCFADMNVPSLPKLYQSISVIAGQEIDTFIDVGYSLNPLSAENPNNMIELVNPVITILDDNQCKYDYLINETLALEAGSGTNILLPGVTAYLLNAVVRLNRVDTVTSPLITYVGINAMPTNVPPGHTRGRRKWDMVIAGGPEQIMLNGVHDAQDMGATIEILREIHADGRVVLVQSIEDQFTGQQATGVPSVNTYAVRIATNPEFITNFDGIYSPDINLGMVEI